MACLSKLNKPDMTLKKYNPIRRKKKKKTNNKDANFNPKKKKKVKKTIRRRRRRRRKQTSLLKRETLSLPEETMDLEAQSKCCFLPIKGRTVC